DPATQDPAGLGDPPDGVLLVLERSGRLRADFGVVQGITVEHGGGTVLADDGRACDPGQLTHIKSAVAENLEHLFEAADDDLGSHDGGRFLTGAGWHGLVPGRPD